MWTLDFTEHISKRPVPSVDQDRGDSGGSAQWSHIRPGPQVGGSIPDFRSSSCHGHSGGPTPRRHQFTSIKPALRTNSGELRFFYFWRRYKNARSYVNRRPRTNPASGPDPRGKCRVNSLTALRRRQFNFCFVCSVKSWIATHCSFVSILENIADNDNYHLKFSNGYIVGYNRV